MSTFDRLWTVLADSTRASLLMALRAAPRSQERDAHVASLEAGRIALLPEHTEF